MRALAFMVVLLTAIMPVNQLLVNYNMNGVICGVYNAIMIILCIYFFNSLFKEEENGIPNTD